MRPHTRPFAPSRGSRSRSVEARRSRAPAPRYSVLEGLASAITPRRAAACVAVVAVGALFASQFVDYREVQVGVRQYQGLNGIAPPPELSAATAQSAHGGWVLALAALALVILIAAGWLRRPALTRLLVPLGVAVIVIALAVDRAHGLAVGQAGVAYQGARAVLLGGFALEVATGAVLVLVGFVIPPEPASVADRRRGPARSSRADRPSPAGTPAPLEPTRAGG